MKPHPRIRKTIKWGGAAVTVLLASLWITTGYRGFMYSVDSGWLLGTASGGITVQRLGIGAQGPPLGWNVLPNSRFSVTWRPRFDSTWQSWFLHVPIWPLVVLSAGSGLSAWRLDALARRRARAGVCPKCGYDRAGLAAGAVCPECGYVP